MVIPETIVAYEVDNPQEKGSQPTTREWMYNPSSKQAAVESAFVLVHE